LIPEYFDKEIFDFIKSNENIDPFELSFRLKHFSPDIRKLISGQIHSRQKLKRKVPEWLEIDQIILPGAVSIEQASSKITACYKSEFVHGGLLVDLTGGLGIDTYFYAGRADSVIYVERDPELAAIAKHNFSLMGMRNMEVICQTAESFLNEWKNDADYFYLDPSRRKPEGRVFKLEDSEPDLLGMQDTLLKRSKLVIIKAAPFIDLQYAIKMVKNLKEIHVVAVDNECKEILMLCTPTYQERDIKIITANYTGKKFHKYSSTAVSERKSFCSINISGQFVYDPNVAIRKAGLFQSICRDFNLSKPAANSHIYFSDTLYLNFPGRIFERIDSIPLNKFIKKPSAKQANIAIRNFPLTVAEIRKRTRIREGGDIYIFGTTDQDNNHYFIICQKVSINNG
jgi:hypothetical protein